MDILKQAKAVGIAATLAVLAGCAGQVNEQAAPAEPAKPELVSRNPVRPVPQR